MLTRAILMGTFCVVVGIASRCTVVYGGSGPKVSIGNPAKYSLVAVTGPAEDDRTSCGDQLGDNWSGE